jgi:hypothetical protein
LRHVSGTLPDEVSAAFAENHRSGPVSQLVPFRTLDKLLLFVERADCDRCFGVAYWKQGQPNVKPFWFCQNFAYSTELDDAPTQPASWGIQLRFLGKPSEEIVIRLNIGPAIPHGDFSWREFFKKAELEVVERPIRRKNDCLNRRSSSEKAPVLDNEE